MAIFSFLYAHHQASACLRFHTGAPLAIKAVGYSEAAHHHRDIRVALSIYRPFSHGVRELSAISTASLVRREIICSLFAIFDRSNKKLWCGHPWIPSIRPMATALEKATPDRFRQHVYLYSFVIDISIKEAFSPACLPVIASRCS
jgi:hypothetical protein